MILFVFGTRPEAIKLIPVIRAVRGRGFPVRICVTGQHRELISPVLSFFGIEPDFDLNVMRVNQSLARLTGKILDGVATVISEARPDLVVVHGDTTTTLAAALAGYYNRVRVAHVEAGLRTQNKYAPFPEEINRKVAGAITDYHFAPTAAARDNLIAEGVSSGLIWVTGNTAIDALLYTHQVVMGRQDALEQKLATAGYRDSTGKPVVLITAHRRENFGDGFQRICSGILQLAQLHPNVSFVYPVHLNPNVRGPVEAILAPKAETSVRNLHLIEPLEYPTFVYLMGKSRVILTDSGGIQEEAPSLNKPVVVMREETERPEAVAAGTATLVGTDETRIVEVVSRFLRNGRGPGLSQNPYGDGRAAERITAVLARELNLHSNNEDPLDRTSSVRTDSYQN